MRWKWFIRLETNVVAIAFWPFGLVFVMLACGLQEDTLSSILFGTLTAIGYWLIMGGIPSFLYCAMENFLQKKEPTDQKGE